MEPDDQPKDLYAPIADLYDVEHRHWIEDLDLYKALTSRSGSPVLDLGCGSGRVGIALAESGHEVHGIDTSDALLAIARRTASARDLSITFERKDIRRFTSEVAFSLVFCALDTLLHLSDSKDLANALDSSFRALRVGGLLALDIVNPTPDLLAIGDGVVRKQSTFRGPNNTEITHFVSWDVDPERQTISAYHFYDWICDQNNVQRCAVSFQLRYWHHDQVEQALRDAGFRQLELYGSSHLDNFHHGSERIVFVGTRPPSR